MTAVAAVNVRVAVASDERALRTLFADARPALPPQLLDLQWQAQSQQYLLARPRARRQIIEVDGVAVGQLIVDDSGTDVHLVDLTIATEHRGRGIARQVLTQLIASGRGVGLTVWSDNRTARRLYEGLGFEYLTPDQEGYLPMRRNPEEVIG